MTFPSQPSMPSARPPRHFRARPSVPPRPAQAAIGPPTESGNRASQVDNHAFAQPRAAPGIPAANADIVARFGKGEVSLGGMMRSTTAAIVHCGEDWRAALRCLDEIETARDRATGRPLRPNVIVFNAAITACARAGQTLAALGLLDEMGRLGVTPDITSHCSAMLACRNSGDVAMALILFGHLRQQPPGSGLYPNHVTWNLMISTLGRYGHADDALRLFDQLLAEGPAKGVFADAFSYASAIGACEKPAYVERALALFEHLQAHGPARDVRTTTVVYNTLIAVLTAAGRLDEALGIFRHLLEHGPAQGTVPSIVTYNILLTACDRTGRHEDAWTLFQHLRQHGPVHGVLADSITYQVAASACGPEHGSELLRAGIAGGVLRPELGFRPHANLLDLREAAVLVHPTRGRRALGVHPGIARAVFRHLRQEATIGPDTLCVVGRRGRGSLRPVIADCMRTAGWRPTHPRVRPDRPERDPALLLGRPEPGGDAEEEAGGHEPPPPAPASTLNPEAAPFHP